MAASSLHRALGGGEAARTELVLIVLSSVVVALASSAAIDGRSLTAGFVQVKLTESDFKVQSPYDVPRNQRYSYDKVTGDKVTVYIDGAHKVTVNAIPSASHYFKFGVYRQRHDISPLMESRWRNITLYTTSSTASASVTCRRSWSSRWLLASLLLVITLAISI